MYDLTEREVELFRSETTLVWIQRPNWHHANWWLCYYSSDERENYAWERAIDQLSIKHGLGAFHQSQRNHDHAVVHPDCDDRYMYHCPGVGHKWEFLYVGCSKWSIEFPDAKLEDLLDLGESSDEALATLLAVWPEIEALALHVPSRL